MHRAHVRREGAESFISSNFTSFPVYTFGVPFWIVAIIGFWYLGLLYCESEGILDRINATRARYYSDD